MAYPTIADAESLLTQLRESPDIRELTPAGRNLVRRKFAEIFDERHFPPVITGQGTITALAITRMGIIAHYPRGILRIAGNLPFFDFLTGRANPVNPYKDQLSRHIWLERLDPSTGRVIISNQMRKDMAEHLQDPGTYHLDFSLSKARRALRSGIHEVVRDFTIHELPESAYSVCFNSERPTFRALNPGETLWTSLVNEFGEKLCDRAVIHYKDGRIENPLGLSRLLNGLPHY